VPTTGEVVDEYLDAQRDVLTRDPHVLYSTADGDEDAAEAVHKTRVAARRFRSMLRICADLFDAAEAKRVDTELAWYAGVLGDVRDLQVLRGHLENVLDTVGSRFGPQQAELGLRIDKMLAAQERRAQRGLHRALVSARLHELQAAVVAFAPGDTDRDVADYVAGAERTARKRLRRTKRLDAQDPDRDALLHRARKAAKRARYTAEMSVPVLGSAAQRSVKRWEAIQDELGAHQDAVVAAAVLRTLVVNDADFTLGVLWAAERAR
jgi:CHAD domain-containing protein